jgi:hypothetical protein
MRFGSLVRQLPVQPKLPSPKLTSADTARALSQIVENQAAIMKDLAQIKNALPWLLAGSFEAAQDISPSQFSNRAIVASFGSLNLHLTQALAD